MIMSYGWSLYYWAYRINILLLDLIPGPWVYFSKHSL